MDYDTTLFWYTASLLQNMLDSPSNGTLNILNLCLRSSSISTPTCIAQNSAPNVLVLMDSWFFCTNGLDIYSWKSQCMSDYADLLYSHHGFHQQTWQQSHNFLFPPVYLAEHCLLHICISQTSHTILTSFHTIWDSHSQTLFLTFCDIWGILLHAKPVQGVPRVVVPGVVIKNPLTV